MFMNDVDRRRFSTMAIAVLALLLLQSLTFDTGAQGPQPGESFELFDTAPPFVAKVIDIAPNGEALFGGARDGISKYNFTTGRFTEVQPITSNYGNEYRGIDHAPSGEALLVGSTPGMTMTIDTEGFKHPKGIPTTGPLSDVAWAPDGSYAIAVGPSGTILKYTPGSSDLEKIDGTTIPMYDILGVAATSLRSISWIPSGEYAIIQTEGQIVYRFNLTSITDMTGPLPSADWTKVRFAPSSSTDRAILISTSGQIYLYDAKMEDYTILTMPVSGYYLGSLAWKDHSTAYIVGWSGTKGGFFKYDGAPVLTDVSPGTQDGVASDLAFLPNGTKGLAVGNAYFRYPDLFPTVPTVSVSSKDLTSITISHSQSQEADFWKYEYYMSLNKGFAVGTGTFIGNDTNKNAQERTFSGLAEKTTYYIIVRVCDWAGQCAASQELEASTLDVTNPTPVTLSVTSTDYTTVGLSWTQFPDQFFQGYEVHMSQTMGFAPDNDTRLSTVFSAGETTGTVSKLISGTTYYFKIRTYNTYKYYADSNEASTTTLQSAPPNPVTAREGEKQIYGLPTIEWTASDSGIFSRYEVHFSSTSGFTPAPATYLAQDEYQGTAGGYSKTYTIPFGPEDEGITFYFRIRVIDSNGGYADSNEVAIVYNIAPPMVSSVSATAVGASEATVHWDPPASHPADFDHYEIYSVLNTKEKRAGSVKNFETTSFKVSGLNAKTQYTFRVYTVDKDGNRSPGVTSGPVTTGSDAMSEFMDTFANEECICSAGAFLIFIFIAIISALGQKYKAKGVAWAIPILVGLIIVIGISALNTLFDAKIDTWFFGWLMLTCLIAGAAAGVGTVIATRSTSSAKKNGIAAVAFASPFLITLLIAYAVTVYNASPDAKTVNRGFIVPMLVVGIIVSVVLVVATISIKKYKDKKWREDYERRQAEERLQKFNNRKAEMRNNIARLEARIDEHRADAPSSMFGEVKRNLKDAQRAWDQAISVENEGHLDNTKTLAENAEKLIVDIEAFVVARQQARGNLANVMGRVNNLKARRAPRIDNANSIYRDAERKLDEAQKLEEVKVVMDLITKVNSACEESATSLKGAEEQLSDLRVQLTQLSSRLTDISANTKEKEASSKISAFIKGIQVIINAQTEEPRLEELARGREQVRQANDLLQQVDDRERQRSVLSNDLDGLRSDMNDTTSWSNAGMEDVEKKLTRAKTALDLDELGKARSALDEGFQLLEEKRNSSVPQLVVLDKQYEMQVNKWEELIIELKNNGSASAQNIDFEIDSPSATLQDIKDKARATYKIAPGESTMVPVKIQFTAEGAVPISFIVRYSDALEREYTEEVPLRVNVASRVFMRPEEPKKTSAKDYGLEIVKRGSISQGFYKFKVSVRNKGEYVARDVNVTLIYDRNIFKLHHIQPQTLKLEGASVYYGDIGPGTTTSGEFYLEAHMCTETKLEGTITFKDMKDLVQTMTIEPHRETFICPSFIEVGEIAPAQVQAFLQDPLWKQDTRTYAVPSNLQLNVVYDTMKESIEKFDPNLKFVFEDCRDDPLVLEAWYYGRAEGKGGDGMQHVIIGKMAQVQRAGCSLQIIGASPHQGQLFALSTRIGDVVSQGIAKAAGLARPIQQIFQTVEIKDSVIQGSQISMGGGQAMGAGEDVKGKVSVKDSVMVRSEVGGGKDVEVEGSVMQRTKVGVPQDQGPTCSTIGIEPQAPPPAAPVNQNLQFAYSIYRDMLRQVYEDGVVTMDERALLKRLRGQLGISMEEHANLEEEVIAERQAKLEKEGKKQ